jgi:Ca-activated chloride channel homolog
VKLRTLSFLSLLGMALSSVSVYALVPPEEGVLAASAVMTASIPFDGPSAASTRFTTEGTLRVEGRVGHARVASGGNTFLLVEVRGTDAQPQSRAPSSLVLVIDRSGSMAGERLGSAIRAAQGLIDRLPDGDRVSVVTFHSRVEVPVPPTVLDAGSRSQVTRGIQGIVSGGETCISCGIEQALDLVHEVEGGLSQVVLLSDGKATEGMRDLEGMGRIADRAGQRGIGITTVGVGVGYEQSLLAALSSRSHGHHRFVENDGGLPVLFADVGEGFAGTVAADARVSIDLPEGVELVRVVDRSFERSGRGVTVPLGALARGETKTVLLEVRTPFAGNGAVPLAHVNVTFHDHVGGGLGSLGGELGAQIAPDGLRTELDPFVAARLEQSRTGALLQEVNTLYERGDIVEAQRRLAAHQQRLSAVAAENNDHAIASADPRAADLAQSFDKQLGMTSRAGRDFNGLRNGSGPRKKAVKNCSPGDPLCADVDASVRQNQEDAFNAFE